MKAGDVFENAVTGMRVRVVQTPQENGGRSVVVEYRLRPGTGRDYTPAHVHRRYTERFEILSGLAAYEIDGVVGTAGPGETVNIPLNTAHVHPWSTGDQELAVRQTTETAAPDLDGLNRVLTSVETLFELARRGRVSANGQPNPLQAAVIFDALFMPDNYVAGIPYGAQRVLFRLMAAAGKLLGYRPVYTFPIEAATTA